MSTFSHNEGPTCSQWSLAAFVIAIIAILVIISCMVVVLCRCHTRLDKQLRRADYLERLAEEQARKLAQLEFAQRGIGSKVEKLGAGSGMAPPPLPAREDRRERFKSVEIKRLKQTLEAKQHEMDEAQRRSAGRSNRRRKDKALFTGVLPGSASVVDIEEKVEEKAGGATVGDKKTRRGQAPDLPQWA